MRATLFLLLLTLAAQAQIPGLNSGRLSRPSFAKPEQEWAVLVGVSQYLHLPRTEWLDGCDADASALASFLQSARGGSFPAEHVKLLVNEGATITAVRRALDATIKAVKSGDVVYLFFACHGKVEAYGGGDVAYLLCYDSDPQFLNATALPMDEVRRYVDVNLRQASQVVLISDACHAGSLGAQPTDRKLFSSMADHLQEVGARDGVLNLMACKRNENAIEDPRLGGHGVLTYVLLKALEGEGGSDKNGVVRAQDVLEYVMRYVPRLTDQQQHPRHSSNYHDEFPMARLKEAGPALNLPPFPSNSVASVTPTSLSMAPQSLATLRVVGAPRDSELYLVQGDEQRTIGRALSASAVLVLENLAPGKYVLVQSLGGKQTEWPLDLGPGRRSFDLRTGN